VLAVSTPYSEGGRFGGEGRSADDDTGYADKVRNIVCSEIADRELGCRRVKQELVFGKLNVLL
jgi:hypothetical protein